MAAVRNRIVVARSVSTLRGRNRRQAAFGNSIVNWVTMLLLVVAEVVGKILRSDSAVVEVAGRKTEKVVVDAWSVEDTWMQWGREDCCCCCCSFSPGEMPWE